MDVARARSPRPTKPRLNQAASGPSGCLRVCVPVERTSIFGRAVEGGQRCLLYTSDAADDM
eukprot:12498764-Alexandrium_andersonii.AAC.2